MTNGQKILNRAWNHLLFDSEDTRQLDCELIEIQHCYTLAAEPEFDRINHGPFQHPTKPCAKCHDKSVIYFGDADGNEHSIPCDCR